MSERRRTYQTGLLIWAAATLLEATILATQEGVFLPFALISAGVNYGLLGLAAVPAWRLCARVREERPSRWRAVAVYAGILLGVLIFWQGSFLGLFYLLRGPGVPTPIEAAGLWFLLGAATTCSLLIAGIVLAQTARALRQQTARQARLKLLAREAEVRALRAQIRPHFFFNVLNSIYSLIETRPAEAQRMVDLVARLMRRTLEVADDELVPLEWELESVRTYLDIEGIRLGSRMEVIYRVDESLAEVAIPPLLLQPVVENAIKHGIAASEQEGRLEVSAEREGEQLILEVRDTGPGIDEAEQDASEMARRGDEGRGLGITRGRLAALYPDRHALELRNLEPSGFEVSIRIPHVHIDAAGALSHA